MLLLMYADEYTTVHTATINCCKSSWIYGETNYYLYTWRPGEWTDGMKETTDTFWISCEWIGKWSFERGTGYARKRDGKHRERRVMIKETNLETENGEYFKREEIPTKLKWIEWTRTATGKTEREASINIYVELAVSCCAAFGSSFMSCIT